ncbi:MAG: DinB family protein [Flammeovirgaceae bacterium]
MMDTQLEFQFKQLQESLDQLLKELSQSSEQELNQVVEKEEWSVLQILYHVKSSERASLAYMKKKLRYLHERRPPKVGFLELLRSLALQGFLRSSLKAKAPHRLAAFPPDLTMDGIAINWIALRKEMEAFLHSLPKDVLDLALYKHPMVGRLSVYQGLNFLQAHFDRHKKQIHDLLERLRVES